MAARYPDQLWDSSDDDDDDNMDDLLRRRRRSSVLESTPLCTGRFRPRSRFPFDVKLIRFRQPPKSQIVLRLCIRTKNGRLLRLLRRMQCAEHRMGTTFLSKPASEPLRSLSRTYGPSLRLNLTNMERSLTTLTILPSKRMGAFAR